MFAGVARNHGDGSDDSLLVRRVGEEIVAVDPEVGAAYGLDSEASAAFAALPGASSRRAFLRAGGRGGRGRECCRSRSAERRCSGKRAVGPTAGVFRFAPAPTHRSWLRAPTPSPWSGVEAAGGTAATVPPRPAATAGRAARSPSVSPSALPVRPSRSWSAPEAVEQMARPVAKGGVAPAMAALEAQGRTTSVRGAEAGVAAR